MENGDSDVQDGLSSLQVWMTTAREQSGFLAGMRVISRASHENAPSQSGEGGYFLG